jgi:hypothetical protein
MSSLALNARQIERICYLLADKWDCGDDDNDESRSWLLFREKLAEVQTTLELHCIAANLNWDYGTRGLTAAIDHPLCDRGTALLLYWLGEPYYALKYRTIDDVPSWDRDEYDLLKRIEEKYLSDSFAHAMIAADPRDIFGEDRLEVWRAEGPDRAPIHVPMTEPTSGWDAGVLVEAARMLGAITWFEGGHLTTEELVQSMTHPGVSRAFDEATIDELQHLAASLAYCEGSRAAQSEVIIELRALLYSLVGCAGAPPC